MIVGNPSQFAIESGISSAYEGLAVRALGFFVIHLGGYRYGRNLPDSTMLACSFGEVEDRIARRGSHIAPFATASNAGEIADSIRNAIYADQQHEFYFGLPLTAFHDLIYANHLLWAPDGDEAFDDGSYVLQFDVGDRVRLIGFKSIGSYIHDSSTLRDVWLEADEFYYTLSQWQIDFESEWKVMPKIPEGQF